MASDKSFVEFIVDQMGNAGCISHKKMFGEYALYCDGKVVALVCDNQLFVKPTKGGRAYIGTVVEAPPYPGASLYFLIAAAVEDRNWLSGLIKTTAHELALPQQKRRRGRRCAAAPCGAARDAGRARLGTERTLDKEADEC